MKLIRKPTMRKPMFMPLAAAFVLLSGLAVRADYPALILSNNPVAYYRLEETSGGTAFDSSSNHFDGLYIPDSTSAWPHLGQPGITTNSVGFNGGADYATVVIPYHPELSPTNGDGVTGAPFSAEC